jgi:hypothetical protein
MKQAGQAMLDAIKFAVETMVDVGASLELIQEKLKDKIAAVEALENCKINMVMAGDKITFSIVELRLDFLRTRIAQEGKVVALRAKIFGAPIEVKVRKDDANLLLSNIEVADALLELANLVRAMPVSMLECNNKDWPLTLGAWPKGATSDSGDGSDSADLGVVSDAGAGLGVTADAGAGLGVTADAGTGLGVNADAGAGLGVTADAGAGLGVTADAGAGLGVTADAGAGLGVNAGTGADLGVTADTGAGLGVTAGADLGVTADTGAGLGVTAGADLGVTADTGADLGVAAGADLGVTADTSAASKNVDFV